MNAYVNIFKAMGDETRLRILNLLLRVKGKLCVCELVDALQLPQYGISKHLAILKNAGLLDVTREGRWIYYGLNRENSPFLRDFSHLLKDYLHEAFPEDTRKLELRLSLREKGRCIIGSNTPERNE